MAAENPDWSVDGLSWCRSTRFVGILRDFFGIRGEVCGMLWDSLGFEAESVRFRGILGDLGGILWDSGRSLWDVVGF